MSDAIPALHLRAATRLYGSTVRLDRFRTCNRGFSVVAARCGADGRPVFDACGEPDRETIHVESTTDLMELERYLRAGRGVVRLEQST